MASVALAYSQVNDPLLGSFQAIKAHRGRLKKRSAGLLCVQCSQEGRWRTCKDSADRKQL